MSWTHDAAAAVLASSNAGPELGSWQNIHGYSLDPSRIPDPGCTGAPCFRARQQACFSSAPPGLLQYSMSDKLQRNQAWAGQISAGFQTCGGLRGTNPTARSGALGIHGCPKHLGGVGYLKILANYLYKTQLSSGTGEKDPVLAWNLEQHS